MSNKEKESMGNSKSTKRKVKKGKNCNKNPPNVERLKSGSVDDNDELKHDIPDDLDCDGAPHYRCNACKRIVQILKYYNKWNEYHRSSSSLDTDQDNIYDVGMFEYINNSYNLTQLNDDYIHITEEHDNELERLYEYTLNALNITKCNMKSCVMMERNNRSRNRASTDNEYRKSLYNGYEGSDEIMTQQTLDKIHSYILHSFDSLKLTEQEIGIIDEEQEKSYDIDGNKEKYNESDTDLDTDDETIPLKDNTLKQYKNIIDGKKRIMRELNVATLRQNSYKFASTFEDKQDMKNNDDNDGVDDEKDINNDDNDDNDSDYSLSVEINDNNDDNKKLDTYSFGIRWYYWTYYKDLDEMDEVNGGKYKDYYIASIHKDLKDEVIVNPENKLSVDCWNDVISKGSSLMKTRKARILRANVSDLDGNTHYEIPHAQSIHLNHIIALLLYANFTELQKEFTESFRPCIDKKESEKIWFLRHSEYHFWSKYLRECVECFGTDLDEDRNRKNPNFYHGINRVLYFKKTVARFCSPLSVTPEIAVAQNFSSATGLILMIKGYEDYLRMFNVSWLSDYTAESERLFIGGFKRLTIESIINVSTAHNYLYYVKAINNLFDLIQGFKNEYPFDNQTRSIFKKLIFHKEGLFKIKYEEKWKKQQEINKGNKNNDDDEDDDDDDDDDCYDDINGVFTKEILAKWSLSIPEYIKKLFENWCNNTHKRITLNIDRINNEDISGSYKRVKYLFINEDNVWCKLERLCMIFNNLKYIVIKNGLNLHQKTFIKLIKFISNTVLFGDHNDSDHGVCKLKEIVIIKPNEHLLTINNAKKQYENDINKYGWNVKIGSSQITAQNFIKIKRLKKK